MEKLKYIAKVYEEASEELKKQPSFLKALKEIDDMIASYQYFAHPNFEVVQNDDKIVVTVAGSYYNDEHNERNSPCRNVKIFTISLDDEHNLVFEEIGLDGHSKMEKQQQTGIVEVDCNCSKKIYANGTDIVVGKVFSETEKESPLQLDLIPVGNDAKYQFKHWDKDFIGAAMYLFYDAKDWIVRSAKRSKEKLEKVFIDVSVRASSAMGRDGISVKQCIGEFVNMERPEIMRLDGWTPFYDVSKNNVDEVLKEMQNGRGR